MLICCSNLDYNYGTDEDHLSDMLYHSALCISYLL
jgi:hypothetical protein